MIYLAYNLRYNLCALTAAILNPTLSADDAISKFSPQVDRARVNTDELAEMRRLREQGKKWREIGELYGISANAAHARLRRCK